MLILAYSFSLLGSDIRKDHDMTCEKSSLAYIAKVISGETNDNDGEEC